MLPRSTSTTLSHTPAASALWLVRHGESTWNEQGLAQGHRDEAELTAQGTEQAAAVAEQFRGLAVSAVYSSDLRRALQTAAAFRRVLGLPVIVDARLRERSLGVLEGTPLAAAPPDQTGLDAGLVADPDARPDGGESVRQLYRRVAAFCDELAGRPGTEAADVVVVAHGGTLRVLRAYLAGIPVDRMRWEPLKNASVLRIGAFTANNRGGTQ